VLGGVSEVAEREEEGASETSESESARQLVERMLKGMVQVGVATGGLSEVCFSCP